MDSKATQALCFFKSGFNCAQSVALVFCEKYGVDKETMAKVAGGFGGGLRSGEVCGVVSGASMIIGLKFGQSKDGDAESKQLCGEKMTEFIEEFRKENGGNLTCKTLLGYDSRFERDKIVEKNLFETKCTELIKSAVTILEKLGY